MKFPNKITDNRSAVRYSDQATRQANSHNSAICSHVKKQDATKTVNRDMILLQSRMPMNEYEEEQIALPPVSPLSVFIDTTKCQCRRVLTYFVVLTIESESSAPRNKRVVWQRILFSFIYFQIAHVRLLHFYHFLQVFTDLLTTFILNHCTPAASSKSLGQVADAAFCLVIGQPSAMD